MGFVHALEMSRFSISVTLNFVRNKHVVLSNANNLRSSSQQWLKRQLKDPYVELAKIENYRCRSAFKLLEINDKFKFLSDGKIVVDCGASPGSWSQVATRKVNANATKENAPIGKVVSIDKKLIYPIEGATLICNCDFTKIENQNKILSALNNEKPDAIISDMAPNATGTRQLDTERIVTLCYSVAKFGLKFLKVDPKSVLLMKLWQCEEAKRLEQDLSRFFRLVKFVKPNASRSNSSEVFIIAIGLIGLYILSLTFQKFFLSHFQSVDNKKK